MTKLFLTAQEKLCKLSNMQSRCIHSGKYIIYAWISVQEENTKSHKPRQEERWRSWHLEKHKTIEKQRFSQPHLYCSCRWNFTPCSHSSCQIDIWEWHAEVGRRAKYPHLLSLNASLILPLCYPSGASERELEVLTMLAEVALTPGNGG